MVGICENLAKVGATQKGCFVLGIHVGTFLRVHGRQSEEAPVNDLSALWEFLIAWAREWVRGSAPLDLGAGTPQTSALQCRGRQLIEIARRGPDASGRGPEACPMASQGISRGLTGHAPWLQRA